MVPRLFTSIFYPELLVSSIIMANKDHFEDGEAYQEAGKKSSLGLLDAYIDARSQASLPEIANLIEELTQKGVPLDDRKA